jgi:hypothetical protein
MTSRAGSGSLDLSGASVIVAAFNGTDVLTSCARYRQRDQRTEPSAFSVQVNETLQALVRG